MKRAIGAVVLVLAATGILLTSVLAEINPDAELFWPQWRGPYATGVSQYATPPLEWSATQNIRWKGEIPGRGSSSPVVWGDRVFLLTAIPVGMSVEASHDPRGPWTMMTGDGGFRFTLDMDQ